MSDTENPPDNTAADLSASGTPTPKATPKSKGRGRGRKSAAAKKSATAAMASAAPAANAANAPRKAAGGRRGRTKQFEDDSIQAKYERQREIKSCFAELAALMKPALIDLAERETDSVKNDPEYHKKQDEYQSITDELSSTLKHRLRQADLCLARQRSAHKKITEVNHYITDASFMVSFQDILQLAHAYDLLSNSEWIR